MAADPWAGFPAVDPDPDIQYLKPPVQTPTSPTVGDVMQNPAIQGPGAQSLGTLPSTPLTVGDVMQNPSLQESGVQSLGTLPPDMTSSNLAMIRGRFAQELQDPDVQNRFFKTINAEVGSQGTEAHQAFVESVFNRAAARGQTLSRTLSGRYWDSRTLAAQNRPLPSDAPDFTPVIKNVFGGSNLSNFATGNGTGSNVVFKAGGEHFVLEPADAKWVTGMSRIAEQAPTPAPVPYGLGTGGRLSLAQAQAALAGQAQPPSPLMGSAINMFFPTLRRF
jgi:hypothetical protein